MPNPYREIFRAPGAKGFASAAFIARLPLSMAAIGIVAMLSQTHGEYWLAGAVSAAFAFSFAIISPQVSRLADRLGQSAVLVPATIVSVLAFVGLLLATNLRWPSWTLFVFAVLAAVMPSMPAMVRARWSELFSGRPELTTAFAFESAADELVYVAGASLAVALSVSLFPEAGILAATVFLAVGTAAFVAQRSTEPPIKPMDSAGNGGSAIRLRSVQIVTLALVFVGAIFSTAEVTTVAVTKSLGQPSSASYVIGVYAVGSFLVGLIVGAMQIKTPLHRQIAIAIAALALTQIPLLWVNSVPYLAAAIFLSGVAISPTFITAFGLIERRVPPSQLTEGITWVTTGIGMGMAIGAFVAGWVIDHYGAQNGFWVSVAMGAAALATVLLGQRTLADDSGDGQATTDVVAAE